MKKRYIKPSVESYKMQHQSPLLTVSKLNGDNSFGWGNPLDDR